jgi:hypothetical protein
MADEPAGSGTPPAVTPPPGALPPGAVSESDEPTDAEGWRKYVARINRESATRRRELEALQAKLKEKDDAEKSELQRAVERAEAAERKAAQSERGLLRQRIGLEAKLPAELIDMIQGDDEEAMKAAAARLAQYVRPNGDLGGGRGGSAAPPADDMNARIRAAAGRTQ